MGTRRPALTNLGRAYIAHSDHAVISAADTYSTITRHTCSCGVPHTPGPAGPMGPAGPAGPPGPPAPPTAPTMRPLFSSQPVSPSPMNDYWCLINHMLGTRDLIIQPYAQEGGYMKSVWLYEAVILDTISLKIRAGHIDSTDGRFVPQPLDRVVLLGAMW